MNNIQTFNRLAPMFYFERDAAVVNGTTVPFAPMDLGTIEERTSKVDDGLESIMDDRNGISQPIAEIQNSFDLTYELTTPNTSAVILDMYYRANPLAAPLTNMSAGTFTTVPITLFAGAPAKIRDSTGNGREMIASITAFTVASTPMVFGVDYSYTSDDLDRGIIYILPTSTLVTGSAGVAGMISYTTTAITGNVQLVPGTGPCVVRGYGEIHFASCGQRKVRERGIYSVSIPELNLDPKKAARVKPVVRRMFDPTLSTPNDVLFTKGYPTP